MIGQVTARQFHAADGVEDWRCLYHVVSAYFRTPSLTKGIALVDEIGRLASDAQQQYLNVDLRHAGVTVFLSVRDVALAPVAGYAPILFEFTESQEPRRRPHPLP
jgi:4a-hydroxytetrahydrobiopterin dehydratase